MFEGPEYASYIALMRELRLERKAQAGDWFAEGDPDDASSERLAMCGQDGYQCDDAPAPFWEAGWRVVWLPRLDQWLAMLEEAGWDDVRIIRGQRSQDDGPRYTVRRGSLAEGPLIWVSSPEEAAARAWCAVTGREVTSG